jgi:hypothetical protein
VTYTGAMPGSEIEVFAEIYYRDLTTLEQGLHSTLSDLSTADVAGAGTVDFDVPSPPSGYAHYVNSVTYEIVTPGTGGDPETWEACDLGEDASGQLTLENGDIVYNFVQMRAAWWGAVPGVTRTIRFYWQSAPYGTDAYYDDGYTDVPVTGVSLPAVSATAWVDVPYSEGIQTRLRNARLLPP